MAEADRHRLAPSPFLRGKVMASLSRSGNNIAPPVAGPLSSWRQRILNGGVVVWTAALILISASILSVLFLRTLQYRTHQRTESSAVVFHTATQQLASIMSSANAETLFGWSKALDRPLESEIHLVVSDAKTAFHLLAQNFLPENGRTP